MNKNIIRRVPLLAAALLGSACVSSAAFAHVDVGVYLGAPAPVYVEQPAVVYQAPPPPVVYAPAPAYYGYGDGDGYREEHWRHDNGRHRGWEHHHHGDDDD